MRKVYISLSANLTMVGLANYLLYEVQLSQEATFRYLDRMDAFVQSLAMPVDYALCRFKEWRARGWRCVVFEKKWIIAYEVFDEGVIVQDIKAAKMMIE